MLIIELRTRLSNVAVLWKPQRKISDKDLVIPIARVMCAVVQGAEVAVILAIGGKVAPMREALEEMILLLQLFQLA